MCYQGEVRDGKVVLDDEAALPNGTRVEVIPLGNGAQESLDATVDDGSLAAKLLELSGSCKGLPADLARNHDHYIYGTPKK